jgi:hypothetical protein
MNDYFRFGRNKQDKLIIYRYVFTKRQLSQTSLRSATLLKLQPISEFASLETTAKIVNCFGNPLFEVNPWFPT